MRKLKVSLLLLFSMVLSLCLFACTPKEEAKQIARATLTDSGSSITLTDTETADEATRETAFNNAVRETVVVRVFFTDDSAPVNIAGDQCDYDTSAVVWGTVGVYYATVTPRSTDTFTNENNISASGQLEIRIDHSFGEPNELGESSCACGATRTQVTLPEGQAEGITVNAFHATPVNDTSNGDLAQITPFGTTASGDVVSSMTASTIRKGSSIVLTGTVQSIPPEGDANVWYYPNLGIALRNYPEVSNFNTSSTYDGEQGMGIIVRNDGWVLMDGIGTPRLLAALAGGSSNSYNYGSHPVAGVPTTSMPFEYDPTNMPADPATWGDWAVYSSGTQSTTGTYENVQNVRFTFSFRADNVIEIINENLTAGTTFTARIKVPAAYQNMSFDTVLHGEYVEMTFDSITIIEQEKLESVTFNGLGSDAKVNYVAGEVVNFDDFDGTIQIKYMNNDALLAPDSYSLQVYRGENKDGATEPAENAEGWVTLEETTRLEADDTYFRIAVTVGNTTCYDTVKVGDANFFQKIAANTVSEVYGYRVENAGIIYDSSLLANVGFAANADATQVVITLTGTAKALPADAAILSGCEGYVALRIYGSDFGTPASAQNNIVFAQSTQTYLDVIVGIGGDNDEVVITGANPTDICIDLSGVALPGYASEIASITVDGYSQPLSTIPVNTGAEVTFRYTIDASIADEIRFGSSNRTSDMYTIAQFEEGDTRRFAYEYEAAYADGVFTLTITVPAAPTQATAVQIYVNVPSTGLTAYDTVYYGAPVGNLGNGQIVTLDNGYSAYVAADGTTLYYYVVYQTAEGQSLTDAAIALSDLWLNLNGGQEEYFSNIDLGFSYANGTLTMDSEIVNGNVAVFGTTDDNFDIDAGFLFVGTINARDRGVSANAATWYYQLMSDPALEAQENIYQVTVGDATVIAEYPIETPEEVTLSQSSCESTGLVINAILDAEDEVIFAYNPLYATSHTWVETDTHGLFECSVCGALYTDIATGYEIASEAIGGMLDEGKTLAETGLTVSFLMYGATSDWSAQGLATGKNAAGAKLMFITMPNLDAWGVWPTVKEGDKEVIGDACGIPDATAREAELARLVGSTNAYPTADNLKNGAAYDVFLNKEVYATIVVSVSGGIQYYANGQLVVEYAPNADLTTGNGLQKLQAQNFAELFLLLAERQGITIANGGMSAEDVIVQAAALTAEQVATRYNNYVLEANNYPNAHTWNTDSTTADYDHCTVCGALNPNHGNVALGGQPHVYVTDQNADNYDTCIACGEIHPDHGEEGHPHVYVGVACKVCGAINPDHTTHTYVNGVCSGCGYLCPHEGVTKVGDYCSACGGTLGEDTTVADAEELASLNTGWLAQGFRTYNLYKNSTFTVTAKFADVTAENDNGVAWPGWSGFVTRLYVNGASGESLFLQGNNNVLNNTVGTGLSVAEGHAVNEEGALADYTGTDKTGFTWKLTITWASDNALTIKLEVWEANADLSGAPSKTGTQYFTVNDNVTSLSTIIGADSVVLESYSVTTQSYTYAPHEHSWEDGVCATCGDVCAHENVTDGVCSECGGTVTESDYTIAEEPFVFGMAGYLATPDAMVYEGRDLVFTFTYEANAADTTYNEWDSVNLVIKSADGASMVYMLRQAGRDWIGADDQWGTVNAGTTITASEAFDLATFNSLKRDGTVKITVHLSEGTMTVTYDLYAADAPDTVAMTFSYTITGLTESAYRIGIGFADQSQCVGDTVAVHGTTVSYPEE